MAISAVVLADSISNTGSRITTFQVRFPRFILPELNTHRLFSRNASSSRAIPIKKMVADIRREPVMPIHWGQNRPGMQATEELTGWKLKTMKAVWLGGMFTATWLAGVADRLGAHKQVANRLIECWAHSNVVITATNFSNFFALRRHKDAQPEIKALADAMFEAMQASEPRLLAPGEWHLPYITAEDRQAAMNFGAAHHGHVDLTAVPHDLRRAMGIKAIDLLLIGVSVARCARTSYNLHDGSKTTFEKDFALYERLLGAAPIHASPAEHMAMAPELDENFHPMWRDYWGNLTGFVQFRKLLPDECQ